MKVTVNKEGTKLTIEADIEQTPAPSSTGKTLMVASTHGAAKAGVNVQGKELYVNLNAYIKP